MLTITGDVRTAIEIADISEQEFCELPRIMTIAMNEAAYPHLWNIFTDNSNLILCSVWVERSLSEIYDFKVDYLKVKAHTAAEFKDKVKGVSDGNFVVHVSEIDYIESRGFEFALVPLDSLKLPEETWIQLRKHFIDVILKEL